jgi:hypothetical protein
VRRFINITLPSLHSNSNHAQSCIICSAVASLGLRPLQSIATPIVQGLSGRLEEAAQEICKLLNVGHGDMQVRWHPLKPIRCFEEQFEKKRTQP